MSNTLLALFFLSMGLNLIDTALQFNGAYDSVPSLAFWSSCVPLLFGPFLYLYVQSLLVKDFVLEKGKWIHFAPFIFCFAVTEVSYLSRPQELQLKMLQNLETQTPQFLTWTGSLIFVIFFLYLLASSFLIKRFKKTAIHSLSGSTYNNLGSISALIFFCMMLVVLAVICQLALLTAWAKYAYAVFAFMLLLLIVFIAKVLIKAMQKADLFSIIEDSPRPVPQFSEIQAAEKQDLISKLKDHMEKQKPYLEPELTIDELANQMSIRPKLLSHLINDSLKQNFFDFVNRYRIEEARSLLSAVGGEGGDRKLTVLEVMYQVGFNSKSSFNTLFKKYTGKTPSEIKKRL